MKPVVLSYSPIDTDKMVRLSERLVDSGFKVWTGLDLQPGTPEWQDAMQAVVSNAACLVVLLSPDARKSPEVEYTLRMVKAQKLRMFPVLLRGNIPNAVPFELSASQWIDLRHGRDYDAGMNSLIHLLRQYLGTSDVGTPNEIAVEEVAPYGKLEIFWPDGRFEAYVLTTDSVTIGQGEGNTIRLDTETLSRYHACIDYIDDIVTLSDMGSEDGTYVNGKRLISNTACTLDDIAEIQIGSLRLLYHPLDTTHSEPESTDFIVELEKHLLEVHPGAPRTFGIQVTNTSSQAHTYLFDIEGLPQGWVEIDRQEFTLMPDETIDMLVRFDIPRDSLIAPGDHVATVRVWLKDQHEVMLETGVMLQVGDFRGLSAHLSDQHITADEMLNLYVRNHSNVPLNLHISLQSKGGRLYFRRPSQTLVLGPGNRARVPIEVSLKEKDPRVDDIRPFDVHIVSQDAAGWLVTLRAYVHARPGADWRV